MLKNTEPIIEFKTNEEIADSYFRKALELFEFDNYTECYKTIIEAHKNYLSEKDIEGVSTCLSLMGLVRYYIEDNSYYKSLLILEDAKYLAENTGSEIAININRYAFGQILFEEKNYKDAKIYLEKSTEIQETKLCYIQAKSFETLALAYYKSNEPENAIKIIKKGIDYTRNYGLKTSEERLKKIAQKIERTPENTQHTPLSSDTKGIGKDPLIALLKIARTINAQIDLNTLLTTIAEQTRLALNADRCTVFLIDKERKELWSKVALGLNNSQEIRFPMNKGFAGHVAMTGETIHIKDAYNDERFNRDIDIQTGYKTYNVLCMPIRNIKYEIIGVFQVLNKYNGEFDSHDEDLLLTIGSSAGIAIENNRLFNIQQKMLEEQKEMFSSFINTLAASIDARDKITMGHSKRVKMYAELICNELKLNKSDTEAIVQAAMLHDIGKIGIRDAVLQKEGKLTPEEYEHIKQHVVITHDILSNISLTDTFKEIVEIASSHHEKFDGSGYFRKLKGNEIHFGGRILAVSDVFDAITSVRHYRDKMPIKDAIQILIDGKNKHFDTVMVDALLNVPCDKIIDVFLTEYNSYLDNNNRIKLATKKLYELYEFLIKENKTSADIEFIELFESYYNNKKGN